MATVGTIDCNSMLQIEHRINSGDKSMMVSRVFFTLSIEERGQYHLFADISQPYGTDFEAEPIEVSQPYLREHDKLPEMSLNSPYQFKPYSGMFNHNQFSDGVEDYYRSQVGISGGFVRTSSSSSGYMGNNRMVKHLQFFILMDEPSHAGPW